MSAEISEVDTMAYAVAGGVPWHGLGTPVGDCTTSQEMRKAAGLDWEVEELPLWAYPEDAPAVPVHTHKVTARSTDRAILGVVTKDYRVLQNAEVFDWLDSVFADGLLVYETAGSLKGGRIVWALARFPEDVEIAGDLHRNYLMLTSGHDGAHAVFPRAVNTRVVCWNTRGEALAENDGHRFRFLHTRGLDDKLSMAREAFSMTSAAHQRMKAYLERAALTPLTERQYDRVVEEVFGKPEDNMGKIVAGKFDRFRAIAGAEFSRQGMTGYSLIQALTGYADHVRSGVVSDDWTIARRERRMEALTIGTGAQWKARAEAVVREVLSI